MPEAILGDNFLIYRAFFKGALSTLIYINPNLSQQLFGRV